MFIVKLANINHTPVDFSLLPTSVIEETESRHAQSLNQARKTQFLLCRSLLASLLKRYYQIPVLPEIRRDHNSKPHFCDPALPSFNISHSQNYVAVAIASHSQIGIDLEVERPRKSYQAVANTFFSADEKSWLSQQHDPLNAFWQLWTRKESALKLYSKGVWQMKSVNVNIDKNIITAPFAAPFYCKYQQIDNLHLSVSSNKAIDDLTIEFYE